MATGGENLMKAVVIGATGATGKCLVGSLLKAKVMSNECYIIINSERKEEGGRDGWVGGWGNI